MCAQWQISLEENAIDWNIVLSPHVLAVFQKWKKIKNYFIIVSIILFVKLISVTYGRCERDPSSHSPFDTPISYFLRTAIKHHNQLNLQKKGLFWEYGSMA